MPISLLSHRMHERERSTARSSLTNKPIITTTLCYHLLTLVSSTVVVIPFFIHHISTLWFLPLSQFLPRFPSALFTFVVNIHRQAMTTNNPALVFPHEPLTPIRGQPNNSTIRQLRRELFANAMAIPSTHWGGAHGHLGVVVTVAEYQTLANNAYVPLPPPGNAPVHAAQATQFQIAETNRAFEAHKSDYNLVIAVTNRLRHLVIQAIEPLYLRALEEDEWGLSNKSIGDILEHLKAVYGSISAAEIEANRASLLTAWSIDQPIEVLWNRHNEIKQFALAANEPIPSRVFIDQTLTLFRNTGVFQSGLDAWRRRPEADITYPNLVLHFTAENIDRIQSLTVATAGYHHANAAIEGETKIENLAAAVRDTHINPSPLRHPNNPFGIITSGPDMFYCWTHGLGTNKGHTSRTCKSKATGHVDDATVFDLKGGSNRIMTGRPRLLLPAA